MADQHVVLVFDAPVVQVRRDGIAGKVAADTPRVKLAVRQPAKVKGTVSQGG